MVKVCNRLCAFYKVAQSNRRTYCEGCGGVLSPANLDGEQR